MNFSPSSSSSFSFSSSVNVLSISRTTTTTRRIRASILTAVALFFSVTSEAQTTNESSEAEIQGHQLAQQLCDSQPATNFVRDGLLIVRDGSGKRSQIHLSLNIASTSTGWETTYKIESDAKPSTNGLLIIHHESGRPNKYDFYSHGELKSPITTLSGGQTMIPFAGSDFWIADLGLEFFHWPKQKILKHEMRRGRSCKVLESTNPNPSPGGYLRVVSWIDNETLGIVQAEAYDTKGNLLKEFYPKTFKKVNGQWELQEMEIRNDQTGSRTRLEFDLKRPD